MRGAYGEVGAARLGRVTEPKTRTMTFGHLEIEYDGRVLTPRPWTEAQSSWAAELLVGLPPGDVLELCAGAGHIGLLAIAGTSRHLVQVDADKVAADFALTNAARARSRGDEASGWTVEVRHGWLEEALRPGERFTLVIADPPWVLADRTAHHPADPLTAIDGGPDGLEVARSCLEVIGRHLTEDGAALLQLGGADQVEDVRRHLEQRPDLALRVVGRRGFEDGVVVHLARVPTDATG